MRLGAQPFSCKWVLFAWEWKMVSISKAEHLPSFWKRGSGELGNGLLFDSRPCVTLTNKGSFLIIIIFFLLQGGEGRREEDLVQQLTGNSSLNGLSGSRIISGPQFHDFCRGITTA